MRWTRALTASLIAVHALLSGCKSGEDPAAFSITASNSGTVELLQGATGTLLLTITRNKFDKEIDLDLDGDLPDGVEATFSQDPVPSTEPTVNISFSIPASSAPETVELTVRASAEGVADVLVPITLQINVRGSHTVSLVSSTLTVAQGGGGSAGVRITRVDDNAGSVTLTAVAPAGITATSSGSPTTGSGASIIIAVGASVAIGSHSVTITAAQPGVSPSPQVTLTVNVVAAPATTSVTLAFCSDFTPNWFAFQNEGFNWKQQQPAGNLFSFAATDKVGIAYTFDFGGFAITQVHYATRQELVAAFPQRECLGTRALTGTTANVGSSQYSAVAMGLVGLPIENNAFELDFLPSIPLDLVAVRGAQADLATLIPDRMIVRRGVPATATGALPVLDFNAAEAFDPATTTLTVSGVGADALFVQTNYGGTTRSFNRIFSALPSSTSVTTYSMPVDRAVAGDLHAQFVIAFNNTTERWHFSWYEMAANRSATLSPAQNVPTHTILGTGPYVRFRGQLASQAEYASVARFVYIQEASAVQVEMTAGFAGGLPGSWDVSIPDMTSAAGFNTGWMLTPGAETLAFAEAYSGRPELVFSLDAVFPGIGADPVAGDVVTRGYREVLLSPSAVALRAAGSSRSRFLLLEKRRRFASPQYFRR